MTFNRYIFYKFIYICQYSLSNLMIDILNKSKTLFYLLIRISLIKCNSEIYLTMNSICHNHLFQSKTNKPRLLPWPSYPLINTPQLLRLHYIYWYFFLFAKRKQNTTIVAATSATTIEYHIPSRPKTIGKNTTATTWNTTVLRKEITAETTPSLRAVKNDEPKIPNPQIKNDNA